jgi:L-amino acid N-acyltransferase YncA
MDISIRLAVPNDAFDMAEVIIHSWEATYKGIMPANYIRKKNATRHDLYKRVITDGNDSSYVIEYNGKTVGIMKIAPPTDNDVSDDTYELHYIYLHPDYFRMGIGSKTIEFAFNKARCLGKKYMTVWVLDENVNSIAFYQKSGFITDGKVMDSEYGKKDGRIRMKRDL